MGYRRNRWDRSCATPSRRIETQEWEHRARLIEALAPGLQQGEWTGLDPAEVTRLLDPYFGFARHRDPATMARLLAGET